MVHAPSAKGFIRVSIGRALSTGIIAAGLVFSTAPLSAAPGDEESGSSRAATVRTATGAYLAGRVAQGREDVSGAARFTDKALASMPDEPELQARAFLLHLAAGNIERSLQLAPGILESSPNNLVGRIVLASRDALLGDLDGALTNLATTERESAGQYIIPLLTGWALAGSGDIEAAVAAVEPMLEVPGMKGAALLHLGLIRDYAGDLNGARDSLEAALSNGQTYRVTQALGRLYERVGEPENALTLYDGFNRGGGERPLLAADAERVRAGEPAPDGPLFSTPTQGMAETLADLASLWRREASTDSALIYAQLARYLHPELARATVLVADTLAIRGRTDEALAVYREVPRSNPFSWSARLNESRMIDDGGDMEGAIALLHAMADEVPESTGPLIRIGDIQRSHRHFEEAVEAYDQAQDRQSAAVSNDWSFLYKRGIALERSKQWDRAENDLRAAIALRPDHAHLLNYLGYSYIDRGEMVEE
ncbi:MAG: tetratricopeptide repeat protein, partial [Pseudomonadota bacterium]